MKLEMLNTDKAPEALGPYSQAVKAGEFLYCSGQIALIPGKMEIVEGGIQEQTKQVCENLKAVLEAAGSDLSKVIKTTCFLKDMGQFADFNEIYGKYFGARKPARACVEAAHLPKDVIVEVECIATV